MSWIERIRQKPDREKKMIALTLTVFLTIVIAALWIVAQGVLQN